MKRPTLSRLIVSLDAGRLVLIRHIFIFSMGLRETEGKRLACRALSSLHRETFARLILFCLLLEDGVPTVNLVECLIKQVLLRLAINRSCSVILSSFLPCTLIIPESRSGALPALVTVVVCISVWGKMLKIIRFDSVRCV